jgi:hypothetical protein
MYKVWENYVDEFLGWLSQVNYIQVRDFSLYEISKSIFHRQVLTTLGTWWVIG